VVLGTSPLSFNANPGFYGACGFYQRTRNVRRRKKETIGEFNFKKGILVATFSGIMSACFAFALQAGKHINEASLAAGTSTLWTGLPALTVLLLGGFTTNFLWCAWLNFKNKTGYQYVTSRVPIEPATHGGVSGEPAPAKTTVRTESSDTKIPVLGNYLFSALAGICWYFQFFFYTMGATQMGKYDFASWTLHMASIIIFSTIWGWILHEWKGASKKAHLLIAGGIATLILSTIVIGWGTYLKSR
jgi:L-rhamnose-H+ transport protein